MCVCIVYGCARIVGVLLANEQYVIDIITRLSSKYIQVKMMIVMMVNDVVLGLVLIMHLVAF